MIVTLPFPDMALSANKTKGRHWGSIARMRKKAREAGWWCAKEQLLTPFKAEKVQVKITFWQPDFLVQSEKEPGQEALL